MIKISLILSLIACIISAINFYKLWEFEQDAWNITKTVIEKNSSSDIQYLTYSWISTEPTTPWETIEQVLPNAKNEAWSLKISDCSSITIEKDKTFCINQNLFKAAAEKEDITKCEAIPDTEIKKDCISYIDMLNSQR